MTEVKMGYLFKVIDKNLDFMKTQRDESYDLQVPNHHAGLHWLSRIL
jgi:hypothetical protein